MNVFAQFAASASAHAIEFNRRELLAMKFLNDRELTVDRDSLLACVVAASDPAHIDTVPQHLQRFPWFALLVKFVAKRLHDNVEVDNLQCNTALLQAVPVGVRAHTFDQLIQNLALRIEPPPTLAHDRYARAATLLAVIRSTLVDVERNAERTPVVDECIALTVRTYDAVANELRWLVVPQVVRRQFSCSNLAADVRDSGATDLDCVCDPRWPSLPAALIGACAPDQMTQSAPDRATLTCARLVVLLFDCVEHYLRMGGAQFVRRAAVTLLRGGQGDESMLHLFADALCASIAVVQGFDEQTMLLRPTSTFAVAPERIVVFRRRHTAEESWCIGEVSSAADLQGDLDDHVRKIGDWSSNEPQQQTSLQTFNAIRSGQLEFQQLCFSSSQSASATNINYSNASTAL